MPNPLPTVLSNFRKKPSGETHQPLLELSTLSLTGNAMTSSESDHPAAGTGLASEALPSASALGSYHSSNTSIVIKKAPPTLDTLPSALIEANILPFLTLKDSFPLRATCSSLNGDANSQLIRTGISHTLQTRSQRLETRIQRELQHDECNYCASYTPYIAALFLGGTALLSAVVSEFSSRIKKNQGDQAGNIIMICIFGMAALVCFTCACINAGNFVYDRHNARRLNHLRALTHRFASLEAGAPFAHANNAATASQQPQHQATDNSLPQP